MADRSRFVPGGVQTCPHAWRRPVVQPEQAHVQCPSKRKKAPGAQTRSSHVAEATGPDAFLNRCLRRDPIRFAPVLANLCQRDQFRRPRSQKIVPPTVSASKRHRSSHTSALFTCPSGLVPKVRPFPTCDLLLSARGLSLAETLSPPAPAPGDRRVPLRVRGPSALRSDCPRPPSRASKKRNLWISFWG